MTIAQIAKMAGVSSAAVSRYFNDGYISEEKKEAIRKVVEETGYRPSVQAQMLRTKKTKTIGVIVPKIDSYSIGKVVSGVTRVIEENGYRMLFSISQVNPKKELEYLTVFDDQQVDGVILLATEISPALKKQIKKMSVPVVLVGQQLSGNYCVYHDDYHAMYDIASHLIDQGKKNFGYIGVTMKDVAVGKNRYDGVVAALKSAKLTLSDEQTAIGDFTIQAGYDGLEQILSSSKKKIDAVVCATDKIAYGAIKCAKDHGIKIPEDMVVTGQGNSVLGESVTPGITSIRFFYEESGTEAARLLMNAISGKENIVQEMKLGYELVLRQSTEG